MRLEAVGISHHASKVDGTVLLIATLHKISTAWLIQQVCSGAGQMAVTFLMCCCRQHNPGASWNGAYEADAEGRSI